MRRRQFISLLGCAAAAWPVAARAQDRERPRRIGVLLHLPADDPEGQTRYSAFLQGLQEEGWATDIESMKRAAKELVALQPDLIFTSSTPATGVMAQTTSTIPVIFVLVADPVGMGIVANLPRPGGNVTGFTPIVSSLGGKWVERLKEIAPRTARVSLLFNPPSAPFIDTYLGPFKSAAASLGMQAIAAPVHDLTELESWFADLAREPNSGLIVMPDAFTEVHRAEIVSLTVRHRIPTINWSRSFTEAGGLISFGPYLVDEYRRAASYANRILRGEKPSQLPVQAPLKFELVINGKTAKALSLTVPQTLLLDAELIE